MIRKILIANRGEIAVRIMRTCQEMGIATVAVYSDADAQALHVHLADEAVPIGPAPAQESYLQIETILDAARRTDADAVHPGYGFLAENPDFAQAVLDAGLIFVGPSPQAMAAVGSKTTARAVAEEAGVPVIPGYQASQADEDLAGAAQELGYPVLVKAVAGGGGKGMRLVKDPEELAAALAAARREARGAFGDDRIYLEKAIPAPRHVEIQVVGDHHGQIIYLGERDCSVQRRHQKIVEESPSPVVHRELRQAMGRAAVAVAQAAGYTNAGTAEFLLDAEGNFYFLEMNARLQVEHPVTEWLTGVDLVRWQIRIADGERLPLRQEQVQLRGHAIECRIYAEDPANDFLPAVGRILRLQEPAGPGVRVDSGLRSGDEVTRFYDPMIAKLIVHGEDRAAATTRALRALKDFVILGDLTTNLAFLQDVIAHPVFQAGEATTAFVEEHFSDWQPAPGPTPDAVFIAAALADLLERPAAPPRETSTGDPYSPWQRLTGLRV